MKDNDVIEPSLSPWASPIVLARKKDGSTRFCVDYRRLNNVTKKNSYPRPRIDDTLDTLAYVTFKYLMKTVLGGLLYEACLVYPDDIIIMERSFEEHLKNINVLQKLKEANLKLSPSKCHLFRREVTYLGDIISVEGERTDPD
ncbi:retrovirus-related Pol polyprotein from transposon 17.6 [Trichonephila clavipes]|nr:retrovirus-related Pol polyprotein from transposon 17.6 [Trichonephila clavipes]